MQEKVKEVKPSSRLKDSVACLSGDAHDMSAYMEKLLRASGHEAPPGKRVLEVNVEHPVINRLQTIYAQDASDARLKDYSQMLFDMAVLSEGGKLENPALFSKRIGELLAGALEN